MKQIVEASESDDTFKTGSDYTPNNSHPTLKNNERSNDQKGLNT